MRCRQRLLRSRRRGWSCRQSSPPDRGQSAEPIGAGQVVALSVHEPLELVEYASIADRQHVGSDAGGIWKFHRLGAGLAIQWINLRFFNVRNGRCEVLRI